VSSGPPIHTGQPALDLLNTSFFLLPDGTPIERLGDGKAFVAWLVEAEFLEAAAAKKIRQRFGDDALDDVAADARQFREWCRRWLERWRIDPSGDHRPEVLRLNRLLANATSYREVVAAQDGFSVVEHPRIDSVGDLIALVALHVATLVATEEPELVKRCAGDGCVLWFVDRTKAHTRTFCSAASCGNRMKVAAFRARQRQRR
jgi:predicted RNA-binding Zn ribbon-like protein